MNLRLIWDRAEGTMASFASQIEHMQKEIVKLEEEQVERQNKVNHEFIIKYSGYFLLVKRGHLQLPNLEHWVTKIVRILWLNTYS